MARTGRTERGRRTRARIVEAAHLLFVERGYLETSMAAIAAGAGVAVQTLYVSFGSKVAILKECHDVSVVGDDEPIPVLDRPWVAEYQAEQDGPRALAVLMDVLLSITERVSPIYGVIRSGAADPDVSELFETTKQQRLHTDRTLARHLIGKPGIASRLTARHAGDVVYVTTGDELFRMLVVELGWPAKDWKAWALESASSRLLGG